MTTIEVLQIGGTVIASLGGGGLIVLALSNWLGKVWANRVMENDRTKHAADLEALRNELRRATDSELEELKHALSISVANKLRDTQDKLASYRMALDIVVEILGDFDRAAMSGSGEPFSVERFDAHNRNRMRAWGYMAIHSPQSVIDANDALMDYLIKIAHGDSAYNWGAVRALAIALINEIRKDVGIDKNPIEYRGDL